MKNLKIELANTLLSLARSSRNFKDLPENMIFILLQERIEHDNVLRSDILDSLSKTFIDILDDQEAMDEEEDGPTDEELAEIEDEYDDIDYLLEELEPELEALMHPTKEEDEIEERLRLPGIADARIMFRNGD